MTRIVEFFKHYKILKERPRIERIIHRTKNFVEGESRKQRGQFSFLEDGSRIKCIAFATLRLKF
ncbi:hypothetical protein [Wolbachia endosymbiont of Dirofilaria (Dirofilaria) immitis]|uniref:hypothetical protein n=1 Tax=Wolbachia endosymbiont of Dirofilaria (Dirofilaria) immitis TaxID=1812115 RepID=UPI00158D8756|nr:hypothetical protein [Wolbachia endosymbiont of Dirofilaria (Dirofilaria) immitis]QKX02121.1 hypothetical protein GOY12_00790 [Wolbachia endosymbiont of Dirofilaria (Dirofilaria) immitis]